jgi:hypothetical protein
MSTNDPLIHPAPRSMTLGDVEFFEIDFDAKYLAGATDTATQLITLTAPTALGASTEEGDGGALASGVVQVRVEPTAVGTYHAIVQILTAEGREKSYGIQVVVSSATP